MWSLWLSSIHFQIGGQIREYKVYMYNWIWVEFGFHCSQIQFNFIGNGAVNITILISNMVLIWSDLWLNQVTLQSIFCLLWKASNNETPVNLVLPFSRFNLLQIVQIWRENWWICFYSVVYIAKPFSDCWPGHYVTQCFFSFEKIVFLVELYYKRHYYAFQSDLFGILISKNAKKF